jgi:hypothetical protein
MKCNSHKINRPTKNMTKIVTLLHFWTMKYYFYTFKNPTGRRASVREFITRQTCKICDYTVDYMCRTKTSKSPHALTLTKSIVPRKTWRKLWHSYISKLFLTKMQVKFSTFFHHGSLNVIGDKFRFVRNKLSFPWQWYRQSISKWFFVKSQCQSPFPLSLEPWHLLKVDGE